MKGVELYLLLRKWNFKKRERSTLGLIGAIKSIELSALSKVQLHKVRMFYALGHHHHEKWEQFYMCLVFVSLFDLPLETINTKPNDQNQYLTIK